MANGSGRRRRGAPDEGAFVRCRTYGHAWEEWFPADLGPPRYGWRLSLRCTRCTTERHDEIGRNGDVEGRRYIYVDGYRPPTGTEAISRPEYREQLFASLRKRLDQIHAIGTMKGTK
jgi:hypothetical protein